MSACCKKNIIKHQSFNIAFVLRGELHYLSALVDFEVMILESKVSDTSVSQSQWLLMSLLFSELKICILMNLRLLGQLNIWNFFILLFK